MTDEELDLVTEDDMVAALGRRCRAVLVVTLRDSANDTEEPTISFYGGCSTALGLSMRARIFLESLCREADSKRS